MSELNGSVGAVYKCAAYNKSTYIVFTDEDPDTIQDANSGFTAANGFADGMIITVYGSTSNDGDYTIATRADAVLTLDGGDSLTGESDVGNVVHIFTAAPGTEQLGFFNWTLDDGVEIYDVTDFGDGGYRTYITGFKDWSATAEKHYYTTEHQDSLMGTVIWVRFFVRYDDDPDVTNAYYYEGPATISGISTNTPVDGVVEQTITFQGNGPLVKMTKSVAWTT